MTEQRFVDNGDGTITDNWTKLMWVQEDSYLMLKKVSDILACRKISGQNERGFFCGI